MMKTTLGLPVPSLSALFAGAGGRILRYGGLPFISGSGAGRRPVIATPAARPGAAAVAAAPFTTTAPSWLKPWQMPPRPKLPEDELEEVYLKGSGPGGQKIVRCPRPLCPPNLSSPSILLPLPFSSVPSPLLKPSLLTPLLPPPTEQNQQRRPTPAHPHQHRHQMPRNALTDTKPQAGSGDPRRQGGPVPQRGQESRSDRGQRQEEESG